MSNKKIVNATPLSWGGIDFKSRLEVMVYKTLKENNFNVEYEPETVVIWEGYRPKTPYYTKNKKTGLLKEDISKLRDITYTPDFKIIYEGIEIYVEAKGFANDTFPIKKKMFRKYLEGKNAMYFEVYSKKQVLQMINIIKSYDVTKCNK